MLGRLFRVILLCGFLLPLPLQAQTPPPPAATAPEPASSASEPDSEPSSDPRPDALDLATPPSSLPPYQTYFLHLFHALSVPSTPSPPKNPPQSPAPPPDLELAATALHLWTLTRDETDLQHGLALFQSALDSPAFEKYLGTPKSYYLAYATFLLHHAQKLRPQSLEKIRSAFLKEQRTSPPRSSPTPSPEILSGPCLAAFELFPNDPAFEPSRQNLRTWWDQQNQVGDLEEPRNPALAPLLVDLIRIAQMMRKESDLRDSPLRRATFERYRAMVSPSGHFTGPNATTSPDTPQPASLFVLEYAARLYQDPSFSWSARTLFSRIQKNTPPVPTLLPQLAKFQDLLDMPLLKSPPIPPTQKSFITQRPSASGAPQPDKLILQSSFDPDTPRLILDLTPQNPHNPASHPGGILSFIHHQVPLLLPPQSQDTQEPLPPLLCAFHLQPAPQPFPSRSLPRGLWHSIQLDTSSFPCPPHSQDPSSRLFFGLAPAHRPSPPPATSAKPPKPQALLIDHIRLEGPAGILPIEDFETLPASKHTAPSKDASHGSRSLLVKAPENTPTILPAPQPLPFSCADYKVLAYDLKSAAPPPLALLPLHSPTPRAKSAPLPPPFYTALASAKALNRGADCYAELHFEGYGTWDSQLTRRILLTQEGFVFIRDTLTPGKTAQGWTPGCTLTLPGATLRARGERWFASAPRTEIPLASDEPSRERGLCVRFFGPETLSCDAQKRPTPSGQSWLAWSKLPPIRSEAPLSTLTVLVPTLPSTRLPELASRILAREVPLGSEAFVRTGNQTLEVHLGERSWSVRRTEPPNR